MPFPILGLAAALVPTLTGLFTSDTKTQELAEKASTIASTIAGGGDVNEAIKVISGNEELKLQFKAKIEELALLEYQAETERIKIINQTMIAEYNNSDRFKTGWRPFIGWVFGGSICFFITSVTTSFVILVFTGDQRASTLLTMLPDLAASFAGMFQNMLLVLGLGTYMRTKDKQTAAGVPNASIIGTLVNNLTGKNAKKEDGE